MPSVLQINVASNKGSTGKIAENIGLTALQDGWRSYIVHGERYSGKTILEDISFNSTFSEYVHYIISILFDAHGKGSYLTTKKIVKRIREIKPDIVHLHNIHGYYINYKLLFNVLNELNIPIVWTMHDCWPFTGHCVYFDKVGCEKWKEICECCPQLDSYPRAFIDFSKRNYTDKKKYFTQLKNLTLVPVSNWLSSLVSQSFLAKFPRVVIHNGIDLNVFKPRESDLRSQLKLNGKKVILGVADGYGTRKGLNDFIQLSNYLNDEYQIILIGVTESDCAKLPKKIQYLYRTSNQTELAEYYSMANVYVNPTYEDNFPTTNIEALACGTPVITYNTGGSPEAINDQTGIVVEKGNISLLCDSIIRLCNEDRDLIRKQCLLRAEGEFDMNKRFKEYLNLYVNLLK